MCGIIGVTGTAPVVDTLVNGLRRMEYRGYDSAGVVTLHDGVLDVRRCVGRVDNLAALIEKRPLIGSLGIGHTRWATHGAPTENNAHPHVGMKEEIALVHNGVIENHDILRARLASAGVQFKSQTDTEVICQLIESYLPAVAGADPVLEVRASIERAIDELRGTYGLAIIARRCPGVIFATRLGSPLTIGVGRGAHYLASDQAALVSSVEHIVFLNDRELAVLRPDGFEVKHRDGSSAAIAINAISVAAEEVDLGKYPHFMLKEIHEQPEAVENALRGRIDNVEGTAVFGGLNLGRDELRKASRIVFAACGTSWHAALVGEYLLEELAGIPVEVDYASELRYRNAPVDPRALFFAVAQSGETADTLAVLREMKRRKLASLAIVNVVGSSIAREADGGIFLHAGPEIGVAATKTFAAQLCVLTLLGLYFGRMHRLSVAVGQRIIGELRSLPSILRKTLQVSDAVQKIAKKYLESEGVIFLGRGPLFPVALEGALKWKELTYRHAHGYPAGEIKHGPLALIDERTVTIVLAPRGALYEKTIIAVEEIRARKGKVVAVATEGDERIAKLADDVIYVPDVAETFQPIVTVVPLQLLAYHSAVLQGLDVDKPRNLAKSVTVE